MNPPTAHNPDILTCLANLSADEVFTPPKLASAMLDLLPPELFRDPKTTFLDPVCKSGVFLREIARRLNDGLKSEIKDDQQRIDHILTKQVFGLATTELTSLLSRRSLYCSKKADGRLSIATGFTRREGNVHYENLKHTWSVAGRCSLCNASKSGYDRGDDAESYAYPLIHEVDPRKVFDVKFDVIVGNPPYQLSDGGFGRSAAPIYHLFVEQAKKLEPRYLSMVIPARWFAGGKGLDEFRESMLKDTRLRVLVDYLTATDVFSGIGLKGGICYFVWDRDNPGKCRISTHFGDWPVTTSERRLLEEGADIFIRFEEGLSVLRKVMRVENGNEDSLALQDERRFDRLVSPRKPFGLGTTFKGKPTRDEGDVLVYRNGGTGYTPRASIAMAVDVIDKWKLFVGRAGPGTGNKDTYPHKIISTPFIGEPGSVSSETYLYVGPFKTEAQAESALSYISCRLTRFLILLHKPAQGTTRQVYTFVPKLECTRNWTDKDLYERYSLTAKEVDFIEKVVRAMDLNCDASSEVIADADDED